jgi:argininosuccinate lyase
MENTGRILEGLSPTASRILFGATSDASVDAELEHISKVDRAHLVMLVERGIVARDRGSRLLKEIDELRACDFAPLRGRLAPRGIYLLYENYLIEKLSEETGGVLQTGRSRNDLNATTLRLRLRGAYSDLLREALRLQAVLLRRARRFADVVMPAYTHYQAAQPVTYGHYLAGIALAIGRDVARISEVGRGIDYCPLGAGAIGGASLPIDPARTASLLGFAHPVLHSIDAIASRDLILQLLACAAIFGVTLSRLSADLLLWSTAEFGFLSFPDRLVGSSSMMPQKRNPFILEHVQGRSTAALGSFVAAATAMHGKPFTNSIAVGAEAVAPLWKTLQSLTEATTLARLAVDGAIPEQDAMLRAAVEGYTSATELANRLVIKGGMSFRTAHRTVGSLIRDAIQRGGEALQEASLRWRRDERLLISLEGLDPVSIARKSIYGGGAGATSLAACLKVLHDEWYIQMRRKREQARRWRAADAALDTAVRQLGVIS